VCATQETCEATLVR